MKGYYLNNGESNGKERGRGDGNWGYHRVYWGKSYSIQQQEKAHPRNVQLFQFVPQQVICTAAGRGVFLLSKQTPRGRSLSDKSESSLAFGVALHLWHAFVGVLN